MQLKISAPFPSFGDQEAPLVPGSNLPELGRHFVAVFRLSVACWPFFNDTVVVGLRKVPISSR
jgi:hypothetical protein